MERYNIILRTLGATMLALALVLIPLSQAEALSCSDVQPGFSASDCDWSSVCKSWSTNRHITFFGRTIGVQRVDHYKHDYVTLSRPTWVPQCRETNRYCSSSCYFSVDGPIRWFD